MKHTLLIWFLILQAAKVGTAQVYSKARLLTGENGLSDNSVHCFYKDAKGYMWIGTRNGLNQYDGHSFTVFKPSAANSISNEVINAVAGSLDRNLWVATMNGLNCYNPVQKKWHTLLPGPIRDTADLPNNLVWDLHVGADGLLWIACDVFEFCSYNTRTQKFTYYNWPAFAKTISHTNNSQYPSIQKFVPASQHGFWLGTTRGRVRL